MPKLLGDNLHLSRQYVVMEYLPYSIEDKIGPPEASDFHVKLMKMGQQMLSALRELHEAGHIHQDVKPENFRVTADGLVKLLDFGLVKSVYNESNRQNKMG